MHSVRRSSRAGDNKSTFAAAPLTENFNSSLNPSNPRKRGHDNISSPRQQELSPNNCLQSLTSPSSTPTENVGASESALPRTKKKRQNTSRQPHEHIKKDASEIEYSLPAAGEDIPPPVKVTKHKIYSQTRDFSSVQIADGPDGYRGFSLTNNPPPRRDYFAAPLPSWATSTERMTPAITKVEIY